MKYNQPFDQPGSPNASYVNGNPATGTPGSIPPAAAIENPQREIVNLIADCGITGADTDLHQLGKAIQSGQLFSGTATGSANTYAVTLTPAPSALVKGMFILVNFPIGNTGASTIIVNGSSAKNIIYEDGSALQGNDIASGSSAFLKYDGTSWQMGMTKNAVLNVKRSQVVADRGTATQVVPDSTFTRVTAYNTVNVESLGGTTFSSGLMTVGATDAGLWFVSFHTRQTILTVSGFTNGIRVNGTIMMTDGANVPTGGATAHGAGGRLLNLNAGDTVDMVIEQTTGGAVTFNDMYDMTATRLGAS